MTIRSRLVDYASSWSGYHQNIVVRRQRMGAIDNRELNLGVPCAQILSREVAYGDSPRLAQEDPMRTLIGLDVGWSETRRTCGVAVRGSRHALPGARRYGDVEVVKFRLSDLVDVLPRIVTATGESGTLIVIDSPIGSSGPPETERHVDTACSRGGFYRRAQSYPVTQESGRKLRDAGYSLLRDVHWQPWFGGPLPTTAVVVAETNPTTTMAIALQKQDSATLPSRKRRLRDAAGRWYHAKSDWYWTIGAARIASEALGVSAVAEARDHEHSAALWCLALASLMASDDGAVALGNAEGVYVAASRVHSSWADDVARVGLSSGALGSVHIVTAPNVRAPRVDILEEARLPAELPLVQVDSEMRGDEFLMTMTDTAGITARANAWVSTVDFPAEFEVVGAEEVTFMVTPFAGSQSAHQFRVDPTLPVLLQRLGQRVGTMDAGLSGGMRPSGATEVPIVLSQQRPLAVPVRVRRR